MKSNKLPNVNEKLANNSDLYAFEIFGSRLKYVHVISLISISNLNIVCSSKRICPEI